MRSILLLTTLALAVAAAGCADAPPGASGAPLATPSAAEAASLFRQAAGNVPDHYGVTIAVTKEAKELMSGEAMFDEPRETAYFTLKMDPSVAEEGEGASMGMEFPPEGVAIYSSPDGTAVVMGTNVILTPPDEGGAPWMSQGEDNEGFAALTDPDELMEEFTEQNFTVKSVAPTTLRGAPALKLDATVTDEEGTRDITVFLFQEPTRVARVEMPMPADDEQFAGALMAMDVLYGDEVTLAVPEGVKRAVGLRYQSDRASFGFGGFDGSGESDPSAPETWVFQVGGGLALSEIHAEAYEGMVSEDAPPAWSMALSEGSKTVDDVTLTFDDADGDGKVSQGDTITIARGQGSEHFSVSLKDTVTGYRVTPGAGALLALAAIGAAFVARRR